MAVRPDRDAVIERRSSAGAKNHGHQTSGGAMETTVAEDVTASAGTAGPHGQAG